jgi:hypothetical protein
MMRFTGKDKLQEKRYNCYMSERKILIFASAPFVLFLILILLFSIYFFFLAEKHFPLNPYIDTKFSRDFSFEGF